MELHVVVSLTALAMKVKALLIPTFNMRVSKATTFLVTMFRRRNSPDTLLANVALASTRLDGVGTTRGIVIRLELDGINPATAHSVAIFEKKLGHAASWNLLTSSVAIRKTRNLVNKGQILKAGIIGTHSVILFAGMTHRSGLVASASERKGHTNVVVAVTVTDLIIVHLVNRKLDAILLIRTKFEGTGLGPMVTRKESQKRRGQRKLHLVAKVVRNID